MFKKTPFEQKLANLHDFLKGAISGPTFLNNNPQINGYAEGQHLRYHLILLFCNIYNVIYKISKVKSWIHYKPYITFI